MQFTTLALAVLASTATAFPVWNPVIVRAPEVAAYQPPTAPRAIPFPMATGPPMPTGTGYPMKAAEAKRWEKPAAPPAPQPAERDAVPVYPAANPLSSRAQAPWFAMF